jgi:capsular polysaccharide biosynthesis protein/Mrp family chromosome partitioning ATPase
MNDTTAVPTVAERLRRLARIVRTHWLVLVCGTAITAGAAALVAGNGTERYTATSKVVLDESQLVGVSSTTPLVPNPDPERDVNTKVSLVLARPVAQAVRAHLHLNTSLTKLLSMVEAQTESTSNIVDVTATATTPGGARAVANAFVTEYVNYRRALARSSFNAGAAAIRRQLAALGATGTTPQSAALAAQLRQIEIAAASQTGGAIVVAGAGRPTAFTTRPQLELTIVGLVVGLLLSAAVITLLEFTDRTVKDGEDIVTALPVRVLAEIPRTRRVRRALGLDLGRAQAEAYDNLAAQVLLARRRRHLSVLMVTSPGVADAKTTVTLGLAHALARVDQRVLVLNADPRNAERPAPASATLELAGDESVTVLSGGWARDQDEASNSAELVNTIETHRHNVDFVLVDAPSVHHLHNANGLVETVDGALLVARLRWTAATSLNNALEAIDAFALRLVGMVLTNSLLSGPPELGTRGHAALIPLDVSDNGAGLDRGTNPARRARRNGGERQTATAGRTHVSSDDGLAG